MSVEDAVAGAIASYEAEVAKLLHLHEPVIAALAAEVEAAGGVDALSEYFLEVTEGLKDALGAAAANILPLSKDQDHAIVLVERWVADNVANAGARANVLCDAYMQGIEDAKLLIPEEIVRIGAGPKA